MYKIILNNTVVLQTLQKAYPKPANCAEKALNNYLKEASYLINEAIERGRDGIDKKFNLFSIPLTVLSRDKCEIGSSKNGNRRRVHSALQHLGVPILETVEKGCAIKHTLTRVKINPKFVRLTIQLNATFDQEDTFKRKHPDFDKLEQIEIDRDYDRLVVDTVGLSQYIDNLCNVGFTIKEDAASYIIQAKKLLAIASHQGGVLFQKKKLSFFGRTYYEGMSIQNVNKSLRAAMLGKSWEYDIASSSTVWKLQYAQNYINRKKLTGTIEDNFPLSIDYINDKNKLFEKIRPNVFSDYESDIKKQIKQIKECFTALGFGAKLSDDTYLSVKRIPMKQAMAKIIKDEEACHLFIQNQIVKAFREETKKLDDQINWELKKNKPELFATQHPKTQKKLSKNCRVSYLYQHDETKVMDIFRAMAKQNNLTVLANIHDAIVLRDKLTPELKADIEAAMRNATNNPYWRLTEKAIGL